MLVGPSGCGKTTALRMIAGLEPVTSGEILHRRPAGQRCRSQGPGHRHGVPELRPLPAHERPREPRLRAENAQVPEGARSTSACRRRPTSSASTNCWTGKPKQLSGGQRQRVAVGRAIVRKPKVFLFDEPLSNLDAKLRVAMRAEISKLHRRLGATIIYVTHDQVEAMTMANRIFIMNNGQPAAVRRAAGGLPAPGQPVRGRVHRLPGHELHRCHPGAGAAAPIRRRRRFQAAGCPRCFRPRSSPMPAGRSSSACGPRTWRRSARRGRRRRQHPARAGRRGGDPRGGDLRPPDLRGPSIVARMRVPGTAVGRGQTLHVELKMVKTHLFDKETSQTIV